MLHASDQNYTDVRLSDDKMIGLSTSLLEDGHSEPQGQKVCRQKTSIDGKSLGIAREGKQPSRAGRKTNLLQLLDLPWSKMWPLPGSLLGQHMTRSRIEAPWCSNLLTSHSQTPNLGNKSSSFQEARHTMHKND